MTSSGPEGGAWQNSRYIISTSDALQTFAQHLEIFLKAVTSPGQAWQLSSCCLDWLTLALSGTDDCYPAAELWWDLIPTKHWWWDVFLGPALWVQLLFLWAVSYFSILITEGLRHSKEEEPKDLIFTLQTPSFWLLVFCYGQSHCQSPFPSSHGT